MNVNELGNIGKNLAHRFTARKSLSRAHRAGTAVVEWTPDETMLWAEPLFRFNPAVAIHGRTDEPSSRNRGRRNVRAAVFGTPLGEQRWGTGGAASKIFGTTLQSDKDINEIRAQARELCRGSTRRTELACAIDAGIDLKRGAYALAVHPVNTWLDTAIALDEREGKLFLVRSRTISALCHLLAAASGQPTQQCAQFLREFLRWISAVKLQTEEDDGHALPQFQPHQFISITGSVFSTLDRDEVHLDSQIPGIRSVDDKVRKPIYRNVFSRASGDIFVCVSKIGNRLKPRNFREISDEDSSATDGYLLTDEKVWDPQNDYDLLSTEWMRRTMNGPVPKARYQEFFPVKVNFDEFGNCSETRPLNRSGWFVKAPLLFDPTDLLQ